MTTFNKKEIQNLDHLIQYNWTHSKIDLYWRIKNLYKKKNNHQMVVLLLIILVFMRKTRLKLQSMYIEGANDVTPH